MLSTLRAASTNADLDHLALTIAPKLRDLVNRYEPEVGGERPVLDHQPGPRRCHGPVTLRKKRGPGVTSQTDAASPVTNVLVRSAALAAAAGASETSDQL